MLCLQRVMKRVSWMAFWRRCSLALLSGEREGHAKQVLIHKQTSKCSQNMQMFQSILYYLIYRLLFPFTHHLYYPETCVAYETHFFHLPLPLCLYVSVNTQQQICVPLFLFHLPHGSETVVLEVCFGHGYGGAKASPPMIGITTREEGGC